MNIISGIQFTHCCNRFQKCKGIQYNKYTKYAISNIAKELENICSNDGRWDIRHLVYNIRR